MEIISLTATLLAWFMERLVVIFQYNNFLSSEAVQIGWPLVRDVCNMTVVVILLIIAFGTILKISVYHYKTTLFKLIIMAILINFSKTILGFLIDVSQVVMLTFVNGFKGALLINLNSAFGLEHILSMTVNDDGESFEAFGGLLLGLILLIVACFTIAAFFVVLLFRILTLWILVIISPIAFIAYTFPNLQKYWSEFWGHFFKEITIGIVLAFFMWLSLSILSLSITSDSAILNQFSNDPNVIKYGEVSGQDIEYKEGSEEKFSVTVSAISETPKLFTFIVSIALLWMALMFSQKASGAAGTIAGKIGTKLSDIGKGSIKAGLAPITASFKGAGFLAKTVAKRSGKYVERKVLDSATAEGAGIFRKSLMLLTKPGWEGLAKRGDVLLDESRQVASAQAYDFYNKIMTGGKLQTSHATTAESRIAKTKVEDMNVSGLQDVMAKFDLALDMKPSTEKDRVIRGLFAYASKESWIDDLMSIPRIMEDLMEKGSEEEKKYYYLKDIKQKKEDEGFKGEDLEVEISNASIAYDEKREEDLYNETDKEQKWKGLSKEEKDKEFDKLNKVLTGAEQRLIYGHVEIEPPKKKGKFFKEYIIMDHNGDESDAGKDVVYDLEEPAWANGHWEDVGWVRADPETGKQRLLDYTIKDKNGLTEVARERLTEASKRDGPERGQAHMYSARMGDGTNASCDIDESYRRMHELSGNSNEIYKVASATKSRTGNTNVGGSALGAPLSKDESEHTKAHDYKSVSDLRVFLSVLDASMRNGIASYDKSGAQFVSDNSEANRNYAKGAAIEVRQGSKTGFMIVKFDEKEKDKDGKFIRDKDGKSKITGKMIAINAANGAVYDVEKVDSEDGSESRFIVGDKIAKSVKNYGYEKHRMYINGGPGEEDLEDEIRSPKKGKKAKDGKKGEKSEKGKKGEKSEKGEKGEKGEKSEKGEKGEKSANVNQSIQDVINGLDKVAMTLDDFGKQKVTDIKKGVKNNNKEQLVNGSIGLVLESSMVEIGQLKGKDWRASSMARLEFIEILKRQIKKQFRENRSVMNFLMGDLTNSLNDIKDKIKDNNTGKMAIDEFINDKRK